MIGFSIFAHGEMAEWLNATVLKTVEGDEPFGGSNPSLSAPLQTLLTSGVLFLYLPCFISAKRSILKLHAGFFIRWRKKQPPSIPQDEIVLI